MEEKNNKLWVFGIVLLVLLSVAGAIYYFDEEREKEIISDLINRIDRESLEHNYAMGEGNKVTLSPIIINPETKSYNVGITNGNLNISYKNYSITWQPKFLLQNGNLLAWNQIPSNVEKDFWRIKRSPIEYKWGVTFSNISNSQKNALEYLVLERVGVHGLTGSDINVSNGKIIIKNKITLSHKDLFRTYSIPIINKTHIVIGNLDNSWTVCDNEFCTVNHTEANWVDNGDGTWNITFDPEVVLNETAFITFSDLVNVTLELGRFTHLNISDRAIINETNVMLYYPFDVEEYIFEDPDTEALVNRTSDYSFHNNDGEVNVGGDTPDEIGVWNETGGFIGAGYTFDGGENFNNKILIDGEPGDELDILANGQSLTISVWVLIGEPVNFRNFIVKHGDSSGLNSYALVHLGSPFDNRFAIEIDSNTFNFGSSTPFGVPFPIENWYHVVGTFDQSTNTSSIYVNGTLEASGGTAGFSTNTTNDLFIAQAPFNGTIDEVMILNRSMSAAEVLSLFNNQSSRFLPVGEQNLVNQSAFEMNISTGENRINVTTRLLSEVNSTINLTVGFYNGSWFETDPQNISNGTIAIFNISDASTNITLNYTFIAGNSSTNTFYTPVLFGNITYETFSVAAADVAPTFSNNQTNSTLAGTLINHSLQWDDETALAGYIFSFDNGDGVFVNDTFVGFTGTINFSNVLKTANSTVNSKIQWIVYANDSLNQFNVSETYTYNTTSAADTIFPLFDNLKEDPADPTEYNPGNIYELNATVNFTNGTVNIDFDAVNYSATNLSLKEYNYTNNSLAAGTYSYYWWGFGNGTSENFNSTETFTYTVSLNSSSCGVFFNESSPQDYLTPIRVLTNCTSDFTLFLNGSSVSNNSEHLLAASLWNLTVQRDDNSNYSEIQSTELFTIDTINPDANLVNNESYAETFGTPINITFQETNTGDADVTYLVFLNSSSQGAGGIFTLAAGVYNFTLNTTGGQNYTSNSSLDTRELVIAQSADNCGVFFNESSPQDYLTPVTVNTNCTSAFTLLLNGSSVANASEHLLGGGLWNLTVQRTDTQNYSEVQNTELFTIDPINPDANLVNNESYAEGFGTPVNITFQETNTGDDDVTYLVFLNSSSQGAGGIFTLAAGVYNFTLNTTGGQNYTSNSSLDTREFVVSQSADNCGVFFNESSPQDYLVPITVNTNCTSAFTLFLNGSSVGNASEHVLGVGLWNLTVQRTDTQNYSEVQNTELFTVDQINPDAQLVNNTLRTVTYPGLINITFSETNPGDDDVSYLMFRNGSDITSEVNLDISLPVGVYNYSLNTTGGQNYTSNFSLDTFEVVVLINNSACDVLFNETSPIDFPNVFRVFTNCDSTFSLLRNGTAISNNSEQALPASLWNFTIFRTDNENYTNFFDEELFTVNQISSEVNLTLNNTRDNVTINQGDTIDLNCSQISGDSGTNIEMVREGTSINSGASPIGNTTTFTSVQVENITCFYPETENFTASLEIWFVNVTSAPDVTPPVFTDLRNFTHFVNTTFSENINATDVLSGIDTYSLNDTSVFNVSNSGQIINVTPLINVTTYVLNLTVNDTVGNAVSGVFFIDVIEPSGKIMEWRSIMDGFVAGFVTRDGSWNFTLDVLIGRNFEAGGNITTGDVFLLPDGGKLSGNTTCTFLSSPNGLNILEICN